MIVAGIDYSMSSPAICIYDTAKPVDDINSYVFYCLNDTKKTQGVWAGVFNIEPPPEWSCQEERFDAISDWAMSKLLKHGVEKVSLEGYAMGSTKGLIFNIAEHTGNLKQKLWKAGIPFTTPAPTQVKKAYTGSGAAKKPVVCAEFVNRLGVRVSDLYKGKADASPENDLADAHANLMMGLQ